MMSTQADTVQSTAAGIGYGGAALFASFTLADIDLILRILVGAISFVSICVHLYFKVKNERKGK